MKFIPIDKIKILRDSACNGDDRACSILNAQLNGEDYESLLNDYFNPAKVESNLDNQDSSHSGLDIKMVDEPEEECSCHECDHEEEHHGLDIKMVGEEEEKPCVFGEKISDNILMLIGEVDKAIIELTNNDNINDSTKSGIMNSLNELKKQSLDAIAKLKNIRKDIDKKHK